MKTSYFFVFAALMLSGPAFLRAGETASDTTFDHRTWQGIPGLERSAKGRVFVSWFTGGKKEPDSANTVYLCYSDDQGTTFTAPQAMAAPMDGSRAFDPALWIDPSGKFWYFFNRGNKDKAEHGVYARTCKEPDAPTPVWSDEFRIGFDAAPFAFRINKPTALSTGEWVLPVTLATEPVHDWFAGPKQMQGVGISADNGKTWLLHGALKAPEWALENMTVELLDHRLWMLIRTGSGSLWQSHSADRGVTWSEPQASTITNPGARFFIRRLASGNLLLVNHYKFKGRSHITARISTDDGQTWNEGLLLDERSNVSYPDGVQDKDGLIWIVYDRERYGAGEILFATFREEDAVAGKDVSGKVRLKQLVSKLNKPTTLPNQATLAPAKILPPDWNPTEASNKVLQGLVNISAPQVKGAHDSEYVIVGDRAFIVSIANDERAGENPEWESCYAAMSVVNLKTMAVEKHLPVAKSGQAFENETLPPGSCFVPRIIQKDDKTVRCFFASEEPKKRQSQNWYVDFNLDTLAFEKSIHRVKLKTAAGTFDFQPKPLYDDAVIQGFTHPAKDYGAYLFSSFKFFDGKTYVAINNYPGGQNALAALNAERDTIEVLGHFFEPQKLQLCEAAIDRLPDGSWLAIVRQDGGNKNYTFTTSKDGVRWSTNEHRDAVPNGDNSKPVLERFKGIYYMGWQEATRLNGVGRSVFNIDVSRDGEHWERKYHFATERSFQYPTLHEHDGTLYVSVTQGDSDKSRKERIMFGKLE